MNVNKQLLEAVKAFFEAEQSEGKEHNGHIYKPATREHQQREMVARENLRDAISAAERVQQDGYALVPIEPTLEMVIAGEEAWEKHLDKRVFDLWDGKKVAPYPSEETHELCARVAYRAMLKAAQKGNT